MIQLLETEIFSVGIGSDELKSAWTVEDESKEETKKHRMKET
jgi:hypothetical protein